MVTINLKPKDFKTVWQTLEDLAVLCYEEGEYKDGDELMKLANQFQKTAGYPDSLKFKRRKEIKNPPYPQG